ncbi:MAG: hypothetical protein CVU40_13015 [Chloroflexi bacterium HGW-Chloroflexi-2]|jgi:hypothetical protein|nr:MAG: hypothetical protein CVU40_13015 [Chloroflexi bacterium HGW-Chloroflexi-2]
MKSILTKIAAVLAFIIGAMAVFAGAQVLLGNDPGYYVINWVPVYNYTAGILTVFITAILIWRGSKHAWFAAITTFSLHTLVMILLQTVHRDVVAVDSIRAMTIRMIAWAIILVLMFAQSQKDKKAQRLTTVAKS